jgi:ATP-dependent DNA helicase RecQ
MKPLSVEELEERIAPEDRELFVDVVRDMVDEGALKYDAVWNLVPKQKSP